MKRSILTLMVLLFSSTVLIAEDVPGDFNAAVRSAVKGFHDSFKAKNAMGVAALYTEDAVLFPPNSDMVKGRAAIQTFWKGLIDAGFSAELETVETENEGNLGFETGKYRIVGPDGKTADQGKYVVVYSKGPEGWKLHRDIWNSNMPAPTAQ